MFQENVYILEVQRHLLKYVAVTVTDSVWSSGQSSWLQIQSPGFDFRHYQTFCKVVGLERSPLSLVSTFEQLLGRKNSGSGVESREYDRRDPSR
jgi:hypothetical protein